MTKDPANHAAQAHVPAAALEELQPELAPIDERTIPQYNLDAAYASSIVFAALENCAPHLADVARMPKLDMKPIERLASFAHALQHANALVIAHSPSTSTFDDDAVAGRATREYMLLLADVLVNRGLVAQKTVDHIRSGLGNRDLIEDISALRVLLLPHAGTLITAEQLDESAKLVDRLTHGLAQRNGEDPELAPLLVQRRKVAALMVRAYTKLSAAIAFLRLEEGDAGELTPSIYVPAGRPKKEKDSADKPVAPKPAPVEPARPADPRSPSDNPFDDTK